MLKERRRDIPYIRERIKKTYPNFEYLFTSCPDGKDVALALALRLIAEGHPQASLSRVYDSWLMRARCYEFITPDGYVVTLPFGDEAMLIHRTRPGWFVATNAIEKYYDKAFPDDENEKGDPHGQKAESPGSARGR